MQVSAQDMRDEWPAYQVRTHNQSTSSENRMHSDAVAQGYGFKGGLVPGVTVFSHLTQPIVAHHGENWLSRGTADVVFFKPAYEDELLTIRSSHCAATNSSPAYILTCSNDQAVELARMTAGFTNGDIRPDTRADIAPAPMQSERPAVTWDLMEIGTPFPPLRWQPTPAQNVEWCRDVRDELDIYRESVGPLLHPGFILRQANNALRNRFTLPAWIHTGSRLTFHSALRAGSCYEVSAIPEEKWRKKGHEFVRLYVAIRSDTATLVEILHTAIFSPAKSG